MLLAVKQDKLMQYRKNKKLSQYRLSVLAGLSGNAVYRMENEKHKVSPLRAQAVCAVLQCSLEDIFEVTKEETA